MDKMVEAFVKMGKVLINTAEQIERIEKILTSQRQSNIVITSNDLGKLFKTKTGSIVKLVGFHPGSKRACHWDNSKEDVSFDTTTNGLTEPGSPGFDTDIIERCEEEG